jgi:hypothetical protein
MTAPIADPIIVGQTPTADQLARLSVSPTTLPAYDPTTQKLMEMPPVYSNGGLWAVWSVVNLTPSEITATATAVTTADQQLRLKIWEDIKNERNRRTQAGGYKVPVALVDKWFHSDTFSRTQQLGLVIAGVNAPAGPWKTMDGSFVPMTPTLANQIFSAAASSDTALFKYAEQLRSAVNAAVDPTTVNIKIGWPLIFGE